MFLQKGGRAVLWGVTSYKGRGIIELQGRGRNLGNSDVTPPTALYVTYLLDGVD